MSLLRQTARRWAAEAAFEPLVAERAARATSPGPRRKARRTLTLRSVYGLLEAAMPDERPALALALGGGLREHEVLALRRRDLLVVSRQPRGHPRRGQVLPTRIEVLLDVASPSDPYAQRRLRRAPLPLWACEIIEVPEAGLMSKAPNELLFPHRSDPDRPREGFRSVMGRLRLRVLGTHAPPSSLTELRRCWQVVARQAKLPRAVVRQTWSYTPPPPRTPIRSRELDWLRWLAAQWTHLLRSPVAGAIVNPTLLPRRARKGCGADESELTDPWAEWRPLPGSST